MKQSGRLTLTVAAIFVAFAAFAQTPAGADLLWHDVDGIFTDDFNAKMEQQLRLVDREIPGRIVFFAYKQEPAEGAETFFRETTANLQRLDPKLGDGLIFFYFRDTHHAHTESGPGLISRVPNSTIQEILRWSMTGPTAEVLYPDAIQKALTAITFQMRDAFDRPGPGAGVIEHIRHAVRHRYFVYRASHLASSDWQFPPIALLVVLLIAIFVIVNQTRMVEQTIASGKAKHYSKGKIAAEIAGKFAIEGVEVAATVALSALDSGGGSSDSGGGGFSGGGGSFGGGGASGSW